MKQQSVKPRVGATLEEDVKKFLATSPELRQVFLKRMKAECFVPPHVVVPEETRTTNTVEASFLRATGVLVVFSKLKITGKDKKGKGKVFEIEQELGLVYECQCRSVADSTLALFAERNVTFNAWPYHRELIHSTMTRMAIPAFVLPLLNPFRQAAKEKPLPSKGVSGVERRASSQSQS
jgi:preprotein translocase subunit SecB